MSNIEYAALIGVLAVNAAAILVAIFSALRATYVHYKTYCIKAAS